MADMSGTIRSIEIPYKLSILAAVDKYEYTR